MTARIRYNNPLANGAFGLAYHYELLADKKRLDPFCRAVALAARSRSVLESGTGSGIMSIVAARAGAASVYTVERDPVVADFARRNIRACGMDHLVHLIEDDIRNVRLSDIGGKRAEVVIAENLSTWNVTEPQISVMNTINRSLAAPTAIRIPGRAFHRVELACSQYRFADLVDLRTHYFQFSGIPAPAILSRPALFREVDYAQENPERFHGYVDVTAERSGLVNSLRLTSPLQVLGSIAFKSSDGLMPPVIVPLAEDVTVVAGEAVRLEFDYACESEWEQFACSAKTVPATAVGTDYPGPKPIKPFAEPAPSLRSV
jgi:predicted RNA methylase